MPSNPPNSPHPSPHNPHAAAASAYGDNAQKHTPDQRELEARALLKAAKAMVDLQEGWASEPSKDVIEEILNYNRQIWMMFYDAAIENDGGNRPNDLRSNIVNLSNFVFKREIEIMSEPQKGKFDILIHINKEIAAGLMARQTAPDEQPQPQQPPATPDPVTSDNA